MLLLGIFYQERKFSSSCFCENFIEISLVFPSIDLFQYIFEDYLFQLNLFVICLLSLLKVNVTSEEICLIEKECNDTEYSEKNPTSTNS